jgi:subtilisin family serine protease
MKGPPVKYTFKIGGHQVSVREIDSVAAVSPSPDLRSHKTPERLQALFGDIASLDLSHDESTSQIPDDDRDVFERAGWQFVGAPSPLIETTAMRSPHEGSEAVRRVYESNSGTWIGTDLVSLQFDPDVSEREIRFLLRKDDLELVGPLNFAPNAYEARLTGRRPQLEAVQVLQERPWYRFIEPEFLEAITGRYTPSDPGFGSQWFHSNNGSGGGKVGADIRSENAWNVTRGAGIRIAVIDNGMQVDHPDLKDGIIGGGYFVKDSQGYPRFRRWKPGDPGFPDVTHGTTCMGMAGARMDNEICGCGSAPEADLIAIACDYDQTLSQTTLAKAIGYAANPKQLDINASPEDGAHVICCSLGPRRGSVWQMRSTLSMAIDGAAKNGRGGLGVPIFWAVTNLNANIKDDEVCSHAEVLAVSRSNFNDFHGNAGYGQKLEFLAPGVDVYNIKSGSGCGGHTGCSFAAPLAAGVAALVLARHPTWTAARVRQRMQATCDKIGNVVYDPASGKHNNYGFGRINAQRAV